MKSLLGAATSPWARAEEVPGAGNAVVAAAIARDSARAQKAARHHAVPPLSEAGHGAIAGGRDARPQDPVRVAASAYMICRGARGGNCSAARPEMKNRRRRGTRSPHARRRIAHTGSARRSSGPSRRCLSTSCRARSPSTASRRPNRTTPSTGCESFWHLTEGRSWSSASRRLSRLGWSCSC